MKYKKSIVCLLFISILANILLFYSARKYKNIVEDNIEDRLNQVFSSADSLEIELGKIISQKTVDKDELNKILNEYENIIINLSELRGTADKINHKNNDNISNYSLYANIMSDIDKFSADIIKESSSSNTTLTDNDIKFLEKFRKIVNKMQDIHKKYSYTQKDIIYIKKDQWTKILKGLSEVDMN